MKKFFILFLLIFFSLELLAVEKKYVAKKLVNEAALYTKKVGKKEAIKEFNNPYGKFIRGEFYIFALDMKGFVLAHPINKKLIGKNLYKIKDLNRHYFVQDMINKAKDGEGWVNYYWKHPTKRRIMKKSSYVMRIDKNYFIGCGFYHNKKKILAGTIDKKKVLLEYDE